MNKHIKMEYLRCKNCGHEFWSKYPCSSSIYFTVKQPKCDICGSRNTEHIGIGSE